MKISIFTTMTNPDQRMDPWREALNCYKEFADEVIIVGEDFKEEFMWSDIGKMFTEGFNRATGDWVIWMDIDNIFHENNFIDLKNDILKNKNEISIAFPKIQIFTPDRFAVKSVICRAFNKKDFPEIKLNGGGDLCLPTYNNKLIEPKLVKKTKIPIWNYDTVFRTKEIISLDRARFARAWKREFGDYGNRGSGDPQEAFEAWFEMVKLRYNSHIHNLKIEDHPSFILSKLKNLTSEQFGFNGFGLKNIFNPNLKNYIIGYKDRFRYL